MKSLFSYILVLLLFLGGKVEAHFTSAHTGNAEAYMNIYVYSAAIGGQGLEANDEIAVFDGSVCIGVTTLSGSISSIVPIQAAKADGGTANGYTVGHSITIKMWDASAQNEQTATIQFTNPDGSGSVTAPTFIDNASAFVRLSAKLALTINLTATDKVYDGTDNASVAYSVSGGSVSGNVSIVASGGKFNNKNVGTGKSLTGTISISGTDAGNYEFIRVETTTASITAKSLSIANAAVQSKTYDGTAAAQITGATLSGVISGDAVSLNSSSSGTFAQNNVGTDVAVSTAMSISGADAGNYTLTQASGLKANINVRATSIKPNALSKNYGSSDPAFTYQATPAIVSGDSFTGALARTSGESVGTYDYTLGNLTASSNYSLTLDSSTKFQITKKTLSLSGLTVVTKVYDGNTNATLSGTPSLSGIIGSESVSLSGTPLASFSTASAGTGIPVSVSGLSLSGVNFGNYSLNSSLSGNITRKELTVTGASAQNKVYDGTTVATISGASLSGKISGDDVSLATPVTGTFSQYGIGSGIPVSAAPMSLAGSAASNYSLVYPAGLTADITKRDLTVTATNKSKCFGSSLSFSGTEFTTSGLVPGDAVTTVLLSSNGSVSGASSGVYDIVPASANGSGLSNYTLLYANGKLTVDALLVPAISGSASVTQAPATVSYTTDSGMSNYAWSVTSGGKITLGAGTNSVAVNWTDISNQSITVSYTNAGGCLGTSTKSITLFPLPTAVLSGSAAICPETSTKLNVILTGTGPWKITYTDGTSSQTITNINTSPYSIEVTPPAGKTTTYTVTEVSDANNMLNRGTGTAVLSVSPQVYAPVIGAAGTICYASETGLSATVSSGQSGLVKYQWQSSDDNLTWRNISDATSLTYNTGPLFNSAYYRIAASITNCTENVSNVVKVVVNEPLTNSIISSDQQTICYGETPSKLIASPSSGGNGTFSYQWQKKVSDSWINVGSNSLTYQPELLAATTSFRLITRDTGIPSCGSVYSNELVINVKSQVLPGTLSSDQKIVNGAKPVAITSITEGSGDGTITYKWEYSVDSGIIWTQIAGETGLGYAPGILLQPTWFRRITFSTLNGVTCYAASSPVKIAMWPTAIDPLTNVGDELKVFPIKNVEIRILGFIKIKSNARLFDLQGREVINKELEIGDYNSIILPSLRNGVYLFTIQNKEQIRKFKLILGD